MHLIHKVGAIILKDRKILVAKKQDTFIIPGGRIEAGETEEECLRRELQEELGVDLRSAQYFATFEDAASLDPGKRVRMTIYTATIQGNPQPSAEITEIAYINSQHNLKIGGVLQKYILPALLQQGQI